ncbi:MAG: NADH:ubiquinone oxidoreductase [Thermoprotei archaeon]|nr:MAG: NADH:ubiquinone oxidoreductase [Thermoprotei archaeon]
MRSGWLEKALSRVRRSVWVFHLNTGSCNACDIEVLDAITPFFDAERLGVKLVASPRHADVILLTGPVTYEALPKVIRALSAVPRPRLVLAIGSCAVGGGIWYDSYPVLGGFPKLLELLRGRGVIVDRVVYVPGCPARPEAIIHGLAQLVGLLPKKVRRSVREAG